jgi:hypothetical protein
MQQPHPEALHAVSTAKIIILIHTPLHPPPAKLPMRNPGWYTMLSLQDTMKSAANVVCEMLFSPPLENLP